ncbi:MAG: hypothetical protein Roseis2KO_57050 [Roseivirga sp.]
MTGDCRAKPASIEQAFPRGSSPWSRTLELPATGKFVEESHYVTTDDNFESKAWPSTNNEGIKSHLERSFKIYKTYDPNAEIDELYSQTWQKEWTPEEGGYFGQGSVGISQLSELSADMEMWFLTMMWASGKRPEKGTRFLLSANGRNVVVQAGYETGPASEKYIGGVTREVHHWLNTSSASEIRIKKHINQKAALGPVNCN